MKSILKQLSLIAIIMVALTGVLVPVNAEDGSFPVEVSIDVEVNGISTVSVSSENGSPLPEKASLLVDHSASFAFSFEDYGEYLYEVKQESGSDETVYKLAVYVTTTDGYDAVTDVVIFKEGSDFKEEKIVFVNESVVQIDPPVSKKITDKPEKDDEFIFELRSLTKDQPMPEGSQGDIKRMTVKGEEKKEFGIIEFDRPGTYTYEISEIDSGLEGYTYDKSVYTVKVEVFEVEGGLDQVQTNSKDGKEYKEMYFEFTNAYEEPSIPEKIIRSFTIPTTGIKDGKVVYRLNYELILPLIAFIALGTYLIRRRSISSK